MEVMKRTGAAELRVADAELESVALEVAAESVDVGAAESVAELDDAVSVAELDDAESVAEADDAESVELVGGEGAAGGLLERDTAHCLDICTSGSPFGPVTGERVIVQSDVTGPAFLYTTGVNHRTAASFEARKGDSRLRRLGRLERYCLRQRVARVLATEDDRALWGGGRMREVEKRKGKREEEKESGGELMLAEHRAPGYLFGCEKGIS